MYQIVYTLNAPLIAWSASLEEAKTFAAIMEGKGYDVTLYDYSQKPGKKVEKGGKTMEKVDKYTLEQLWRRWENMARNLDMRAESERWDDTQKELRAVARTYRRTAAQLKVQVAILEAQEREGL